MLHLREANLQSRLQQLIREQISVANLPSKARARIREKFSKSRSAYTAPETFDVDRVQLELKVDGAKRTDLIVLSCGEKHPVTLTRAKYGALDIQASLSSSDIDAIVEIKAAPSMSKNQEGFRKDVVKLLAAGERTVTRGIPWGIHFLLVDKAISVGPFTAPGKYGSGADWCSEDHDTLTGICFSDTPPTDGRTFATLWELPLCGKEDLPRRRFAQASLGVTATPLVVL